MGRVSRYKKVKAFDSFAKNGQLMPDTWGLGESGRRTKKRSLTATKLRDQKRKRRKNNAASFENEGFDLPPGDGDDFDLRDLIGSLQKKKQVEPLQPEEKKQKFVKFDLPKANSEVPLQLQEESKEAGLLKVRAEDQKETIDLSRKEGESKNAFKRRMIQEVRDGITQDRMQKTASEKKQRKKEFLNQKKKKKKRKGNKFRTQTDTDPTDAFAGRNPQQHDNENDGFVTGEQAAARAAFGEQAERPPSFQLLPRGATAKKKLANKPRGSVNHEAEQRAVEEIRRKAQAQYAAIKAKRRRDGEFHL